MLDIVHSRCELEFTVSERDRPEQIVRGGILCPQDIEYVRSVAIWFPLDFEDHQAQLTRESCTFRCLRKEQKD